mmetsp:Transcript_6541/g.9916  ORF Transcript_6541/g.9916 Transcript_6541/m.9916 type:complete len:322 (-) Transcript_6541:1703-2668(-)
MMSNHHHPPLHAASFMLRLAIITSIITIQLTAAQLLSAYDQAYGQWKIKLSRNIFGEKWHIETVDPQRSTGKQKQDTANIKKGSALQLMFPNNPIIRQDLDDNEATKEDGDQQNAETSVSLTHKRIRSINCILNLRRNGKFTIHLDDHQKNADTKKCSNNYQPLHGEWFLTPNPYCVTDRHYDEITLISEPRIRRVYLPTTTVVEKATVELRCKLWGRYSAGAVRRKLGWKHGRSRSRMTHGNVLTVKETFNDNGGGSLGDATKLMPQRDIVGTFCGRAIVDLDHNGRKSEYVDYGIVEKGQDAIFDDDEDDMISDAYEDC